MSVVAIFSDGGARGNPGPAAAAAAIIDSNHHTLFEQAVFLGIATNNQAEYIAAALPLEFILRNHRKLQNLPNTINHYLDSELVVKQLTGEYRVKDSLLKPHVANINSLLHLLPMKINFTHIKRQDNSHTDQLVNDTLDRISGVI